METNHTTKQTKTFFGDVDYAHMKPPKNEPKMTKAGVSDHLKTHTAVW